MKLNSRLLALVIGASALVTVASAATETYEIDPVHSSVEFSITHMIGHVKGSFTAFSGTIVVDRANLEASTAEATIQVASVDTHNEKRDTHLKSPDFFDAAKFATLSFKSKSWKKTGDNTYDVTGDLTIKDVTKEVILKVTSNGFGPGMQGGQISGWDIAVLLAASFSVRFM